MKLTDLYDLDKNELLSIFNDNENIKELLRDNLSEHRYLHSLNVASLAQELAKYHGVDPGVAYQAGLLHDLTKGMDVNWHINILEKYEKEKINIDSPVMHGFTAAYFLKELNVVSDEIIDAIYNHTILVSKKPLNLIIFIADKREKGRNIDDDIIDIAKVDLNDAYEKLVLSVDCYLENHGRKIIR